MVIRWACALCLAGSVASAAPPQRVLSMNLCTDQLALLLAGPEQLVSVSALADDPRMSVMAGQTRGLPVNHGLAEEIFLMQPDLVLAGSFSSPATLDLLRRMGVTVEVFAPESDLQDIRDNILKMGRVLGREGEATAMVARLDADVAAMAAPAYPGRAARYSANGYSAGTASLSGQIIALAGFANIAAEVGLNTGGTLPLEVLMLARPDLVIRDQPAAGPARAEEVLDHPGLAAFPMVTTNANWVCGTPFVVRAAKALQGDGG